jgi:predicted transcriptional regulator of viral defense system
VTSLEGFRRLTGSRLRVFATADFQNLTSLAPAAAVHTLRRMERARLVHHLKRGIWALASGIAADPEEAVQHLAYPSPGYVSLESALHAHGVIPQIPAAVTAVTTGRPARYRTPIGEVRFQHLDPLRFGGRDCLGLNPRRVPIASVEKALLDLLYLRYRLGGRPHVADWDVASIAPARLRALAAAYPSNVQKLALSIVPALRGGIRRGRTRYTPVSRTRR